MRIPLLHLRGRFILRPFLCHRRVRLALIVCHLPHSLTASSIVAGEVVRRIRCVLRKLDCHLVQFYSVHGSINPTVRPFLGLKCRFLRRPFNFAVQMQANKLEIRNI
jgi:hypothetical protein